MSNEGFIHGGDIYTHGILEGKKLIDFSSNINPLGVPKGFKENIEEAFEMVERYPDIKYRELKDNIIKYLYKYWGETLEPKNLILGNGASEIIDLSIRKLKRIVIPAPAFSEYSISCEKWGCEIINSSLLSNMDYDYEDIISKLEKADGIIIGNPNNPNGGILNNNKFKEILDLCESTKKLVIVDEAFIEFTEENSTVINYIKEYKCLIIIRALTKFFAVPGIRFGYGITFNDEVIKYMNENQNPWNINSFAELCVKYSLIDEEYINNSKAWIKKEKEYMLKELNHVSIIKQVYITHSNYILCRLKQCDCEELYSYCLKHGIVIRRANNFTGLNDEYVRFAIKNRELNDNLINTLKSFK